MKEKIEQALKLLEGIDNKQVLAAIQHLHSALTPSPETSLKGKLPRDERKKREALLAKKAAFMDAIKDDAVLKIRQEIARLQAEQTKKEVSK